MPDARGSSEGWRPWMAWTEEEGGARDVLDEGCKVCPQLMCTCRRALAESEESPLPVTECAAVEIGREVAAVLGGPEARP